MNVSFLKMKVIDYLLKPGTYILAASLIWYNVYGDSLAFFWGTILYMLIILNRRTDIKKIKLEQTLFDIETPIILDDIIKQCFDEYYITNYAYKDNFYINDSEETKIRTEVCDIVLTRLSKPFLLKLKAYYNQEIIEDIILQKINMVIINFVIENNAQEQSKALELKSAKEEKERYTKIL